jgi:hypothetical protein
MGMVYCGLYTIHRFPASKNTGSDAKLVMPRGQEGAEVHDKRDSGKAAAS